MTDHEYVTPFTDPAATRTELTGGKGASLATLTQAGFPVPPGMIVTADAYRAFIGAWPEFIARARALPVMDAVALNAECRKLRQSLEARPFDKDMTATLREALHPFVNEQRVSVRSSATLEDSASAAFAGQHDSFLGLKGMDDVLEHVRRCWGSLWEDRAVRYRYEKGFDVLQADMAVVVQQMVDADVAGVAFSINPITGATREVLITAAYGLGETVVSGEGEVDTFTVSKANGEVLTRNIGTKTEAIRQVADGTERRAVPGDKQQEPSLSDTQLRELSMLCQAAERHYAFPQDIEWAIAADKIYLLQSRPITEFPASWTRRESAERFPNPITPLTWDFASTGFHESLNHSLGLMGLPPFKGEWFARKDGYIYGNETAIEIFTSGHQIAFKDLPDLIQRVPYMRQQYRWVQELPVHWARDLDRYLLAIGRLGAVNLSSLDNEQLWRHIVEIDDVGRAYFRPNIAISLTQAMLHRLLYRMIAVIEGPERAAAVYDSLTAFCETKTGLVNRDIYELVKIARADGALREMLVHRDRREIVEANATAAHPEFANAFRAFLEVHGHREVDFDAYHATWSGQPWVVLENIRMMLLSENMPEPGLHDQGLRADQSAAEREFLAKVPAEIRNFAAEILRLARTYTGLDDLEHYQTTRLTPPFRAALIELGKRMATDGMLTKPEDVFFVHRATVEQYVAGKATAAAVRAEADQQRRDWEAAAATEPAFKYGEVAVDVEGTALQGLPGSPGSAEGPVKLIYSSDDFGRFNAGDVLVARTTNPAWTPLFYSAAAVITESGGALSHGAVTAREVGIPAVMSVRGALKRFQENQRVHVNGTTGMVTLLET